MSLKALGKEKGCEGVNMCVRESVLHFLIGVK